MEIPRPAPRPADAQLAELIVTGLSGIQAGILLTLGLRGWGDPGIGGGPVPGVLAVLGIGVLAGWLSWIAGRGGWLLAGASIPVALVAGLLLVLGAALGTAAVLDPLPAVIILAAAIAGIAAGLRLPAPSAPRALPVGGVAPDREGAVTAALDGLGSRAAAVAGAIGGRLRRPSGPRRPGAARRTRGRGPSGPELPPMRVAPPGPAVADRPAADRPTSGGPAGAAASPARPASGSRFLGSSRAVDGMELPLDAQPARPASALARPLADVPEATTPTPRVDTRPSGTRPAPAAPPPTAPIAPPRPPAGASATSERGPAAVPDDPFRDLFSGPPSASGGRPPAQPPGA